MISSILNLTTDSFRIDPNAYVRELMQWHFRPETGCKFWLRHAADLGFDPLTDVRGIADLARFPNLIEDFRTALVEDLIPRGLGSSQRIAGIYESSGTTGAPKRFVMFDEWLDTYLSWDNRLEKIAATAGRPLNMLAVVPSGPHMFGEVTTRWARLCGGAKFTVDLDPRWVKIRISQGRAEEADAYAEHIIDQAAHILRTQDVGVLATTPALLERFARRVDLVDLINASVRAIVWSGAQLDADTRELLRSKFFPGIPLLGIYGSTTILGGTKERPGEEFEGNPICDAFSPYFFFRVVDPETGEEVEYGQRGQVVMTHATKYALLPNNLERDMATRIEPPKGTVGSSLAGVGPVAEFRGVPVIEGVY
ncbi:AMP-binding protein (plasmid) [Streptomyces murinus]|uniref:AMP-binding protein n=1 Tax=Streptomyces murinus TaxID=33900 RepID=UPI000A1EF1D0|nr:AMP-binding protein [Streptomyces murinus]WDO11345.1 AMP-binding protein [Streptomyces murinus]